MLSPGGAEVAIERLRTPLTHLCLPRTPSAQRKRVGMKRSCLGFWDPLEVATVGLASRAGGVARAVQPGVQYLYSGTRTTGVAGARAAARADTVLYRRGPHASTNLLECQTRAAEKDVTVGIMVFLSASLQPPSPAKWFDAPDVDRLRPPTSECILPEETPVLPPSYRNQ